MRRARLSLLVFFLFVAVVYAVGVSSDVYLGDETFHLRLARFFYQGSRPVFEPHYDAVRPIGYLLTGPPLWYLGLAFLWKIMGSELSWVTQAYQTGFFVALLISLYQLAKAFLTKEEALFSLWLMAGCPMVVMFSMLLYLDVPATFLLTLMFFLLIKKRYALSGLVSGAAVLMKEQSLFFLPVLFFLILGPLESEISRKIRGGAAFGLALFLTLLPEALFRLRHFGFIHYLRPQPEYRHPELDYWYSPSSLLHDPALAVAYVGLVIPFALGSYFWFRRWEKRDGILWLPALFYSLTSVIFFRNRTLEMRYFMSILPFLCGVGAKGFSALPKKGQALLLVISLLQFAGTVSVAFLRRQMPPGIREAFEFIRRELPERAVVLYPEEIITTSTDRPVVWGRVPHVSSLFWGKNAAEVEEAMKEAFVDYVVIPKRRIYDDSKARHLGGYPAAFVKRIEQGEFSFLEKVYANSEIRIWKLTRGGGNP